jgi:NADH-quinone oxidoreductase subunit N
VLFYLAAYALTNLGAFFAIVAITDRINSDQIADFGGLARRAPGLAVALAFCLVSLTGLPPTVGFIAKLYIFNAAVEADLVWLAIVGTLNTAVSAYYYLRVAYIMFFAEPASEAPLRPARVIQTSVALAALAVLVFGIVPGPLIGAAERAAEVFRLA